MKNKKIQFPIDLETFLREALPGRRTEDRMKIYRESLRNYTPDGHTVLTHTDEEIEKLIILKRQRKFNESQFGVAKRSLQDFLLGFAARNRQNRAKAGAAVRWKDKKTEK